jgi:predicted nucleic acid-binding protein
LIAVLDASAAVRTVMDPESPFRDLLDKADLVIAPELIVAEVCSAFRKYVRARIMARVQAEQAAERAIALVDHLQPLYELVTDVFALASRSDASVYDLFYLALAQRTGATLLTADVPLQQAAARLGIES